MTTTPNKPAALDAVDGNDIWEALFSIMEGNVPDEMSEDVCERLARNFADLSEAQERIDRLGEEIERLKALKTPTPEWFYADGYSSEDCCDGPWEVLERLELGQGKHVVEMQCAGPLPSIWLAVHVRTDDEMVTLETDDREVFTEHASRGEADAALKRDEQ